MCRQDVANELAIELQTKPDFIIGNYSDGNIVASLLAHKLGVTQVGAVLKFTISFFSLVSFCNGHLLLGNLSVSLVLPVLGIFYSAP